MTKEQRIRFDDLTAIERERINKAAEQKKKRDQADLASAELWNKTADGAVRPGFGSVARELASVGFRDIRLHEVVAAIGALQGTIAAKYSDDPRDLVLTVTGSGNRKRLRLYMSPSGAQSFHDVPLSADEVSMACMEMFLRQAELLMGVKKKQPMAEPRNWFRRMIDRFRKHEDKKAGAVNSGPQRSGN